VRPNLGEVCHQQQRRDLDDEGQQAQIVDPHPIEQNRDGLDGEQSQDLNQQ
jgi:hypothetical protein